MFRILSIVLIITCSVQLQSQSPHGDALKINCSDCHDVAGWTTIKTELLFSHDSTNFALEGRHISLNCKDCHSSLVFSEAPNRCNGCHTDIHNMTAGNDCARCHTSQLWIVDNIPELHEENGFPLFGVHGNLNCNQCHASETNLIFNRLGNECISCHENEYIRTVNPNHKTAGFSMNCIDCHNPINNGWESDILGHESFPLTGGHDIKDCNVCHTTGNYSDASPLCVNCHLNEYNNTSNPNHIASQFPTDCGLCHNINSWIPATINHDAAFFPIYSGKHDNEWNSCTDCHINSSNYSVFSCINCHEHNNQNDVDDEHDGVGGYSYNSNACYNCHPAGE